MKYSYIDRVAYRKAFFLTKDGVERLKLRLDGLLKRRLEISKYLRSLDGHGRADPMLYGEQIAALEHTDVEVEEISSILQNAKTIVKPKHPTRVQIGSAVTLRTGSKMSSYTLVSPLEADPNENKISNESPLGSALEGRKLHEVVQVITPRGKTTEYEIIAIE